MKITFGGCGEIAGVLFIMLVLFLVAVERCS